MRQSLRCIDTAIESSNALVTSNCAQATLCCSSLDPSLSSCTDRQRSSRWSAKSVRLPFHQRFLLDIVFCNSFFCSQQTLLFVQIKLWKVASALIIAIAMIVVSSVVDTISLYIGGLVASFLMWFLGLVSVNDARNSVDLSVMVRVESLAPWFLLLELFS